ncbi:MAG: hypothetical protein WA057_04230 [Candidatus Magasanikiibacteriota bacterium]
MRKIFLLSIALITLTFVGAGCVSFSNKSTTSGPAGMFISNNRGDTWTQISAWPTLEGVKNISNSSVYRIVEDPNDNKAMYMATRENGMFYTYDDGKTWQRAEGALSTGFVYAIAVHPQDKCIIYGSNGTKIYRTDDCSRTWKEVYRESRSNTMIAAIAFSHVAPYKVFVIETNGDLLRSFDGSESWSVVNRFKTRLVNIITHPKDNNLIYIISKTNGLYRSNDGGESWVNLAGKMKSFSGSKEYRRHVIDINNPNLIYWVSTYGVLVSDTAGDSWQEIKLLTPPGSADIYGFAVNPKNTKEIYYTATINERSTFYKSMDGGQNWITKKLPSAQIPSILRVHPDHPDWIYLGFTIPPKK